MGETTSNCNHDCSYGARLFAKVPILVDYQSNPYKDTDVVEWFNRVEIANSFYSASGQSACNWLDELEDIYGITDVIVKSESLITNCGLTHEVYKDSDFAIYAVH